MAKANRGPKLSSSSESGESLIPEALAVLNFHLRCSSIKLSKQIQYLENEHGAMIPMEFSRLSAATSFQDFSQVNQVATKRASCFVRVGHRLAWLAVNLLIVCTSARFFTLATLHLEHDRLVEKVWSSSVGGVLATFSDCSPFKNKTGPIDRRNDLARLAELAHEIDQIGSPLQSFVGVGSVTDTFLGWTGALIYLAGFVAIRMRKPRLNLWNFIENRHRERRKFRLELYNLVGSLFVARPAMGRPEARNGPRQHGFHYTMKDDVFGRSHEHLRAWLLDVDQFQDDFERLKARGSAQCDVFVFERQLHRMIRPAHLSGRWHRKVCESLRRMPTIRVLSVSPAIVIMFIILIFETLNRVNVRLAEIKCNATMETNPRAHFSMGQLSPQQRLAYQSYDGSLAEFALLCLIETRLHWKMPVVFNHGLALVSGAAVAILVPLYFGIYIYDYQAKMLWLAQIERQIDRCLSSLTEGVKLAHFGTDSLRMSQRRQESLKFIALAYLNYELFRREQRNYQSLTSILTMQMFVMNITSLVTCYYLCSALQGARNFVTLVLVTYIAVFLNSYFVTCAIRTSKILKLMKNICRLAAFSVDSSLRLSPIVELWAAQILPHQETMGCFAPKLLGISVSFDKIVTFNAYLVALWLFATRE